MFWNTGGGGQRIEIAAFRSLLKNIGQRLSVIHCRRSHGVPKSKVVVGGGWGRRRGNWWRQRGEGAGKFLPVGKMTRHDKTIQN